MPPPAVPPIMKNSSPDLFFVLEPSASVPGASSKHTPFQGGARATSPSLYPTSDSFCRPFYLPGNTGYKLKSCKASVKGP